MHGVLRNILLKCVLQHELQCEYTYLCVCVCNLCMYGVLRNTHTFRGPKLGTYSDWGLSSVLLINKHLSHHHGVLRNTHTQISVMFYVFLVWSQSMSGCVLCVQILFKCVLQHELQCIYVF